jgi:hypothetical protein
MFDELIHPTHHIPGVSSSSSSSSSLPLANTGTSYSCTIGGSELEGRWLRVRKNKQQEKKGQHINDTVMIEFLKWRAHVITG